MSKEFKPCPFCGHSIDIEKDVYDPNKDWHPTFIDPDSGGDPINIHCECGLEFCTGTYDWGEFVKAWNRRANDVDKVVEQLENERKFWENAYDSNLGKEKARSYEHAIEIVKGGGVDGN